VSASQPRSSQALELAGLVSRQLKRNQRATGRHETTPLGETSNSTGYLRDGTLAAFSNCQLPGQFTSSEQLKPAAAQWVCLFQEALSTPARPQGWLARALQVNGGAEHQEGKWTAEFTPHADQRASGTGGISSSEYTNFHVTTGSASQPPSPCQGSVMAGGGRGGTYFRR
jgi:hypothetical protein